VIPAGHDPERGARGNGLRGPLTWLRGIEKLSVLTDRALGEDIIVCGWRDGRICYTHTIAADGGMVD
jgi:hypothetical protein